MGFNEVPPITMNHAKSPTAAVRRAVESLESRRLMHGGFDATFNFQPEGSPVAPGTIADYGYAYNDRGNGHTYGWNGDARGIMRDRNKTSDQRLDTVAQIQQSGALYRWELAVPNGQYEVTITAGDSKYLDGEHHIAAEGTRVMYGVQSAKKQYLNTTKLITVTDGKLTISPESTGVNSKMISVGVKSHHDAADLPSVSVHATKASLYEAGADSQATLLFSRTGDTDEPLVVHVAWSGSAGTKDFRGRGTEVTIPAGQNSAVYTLTGRDDQVGEATETAKVVIVPGDDYNPSADKNAAVSLFDGRTPDQPPSGKPKVSVVASDAFASEDGDLGEYTITRDVATDALSIFWNWSSLATSADYQIGIVRPGGTTFTARPNTINFEIGQTEIRLRLRAIDDSAAEGNEHATLNLIASTGAYTVNPDAASAAIRIADNDGTSARPVITIAATDGHATEGGNTGAMRLTRTGDLSASMVVELAWSASAGSGDVNRPGTVTFAAGSSTATITLTATDDALAESDETATATIVTGAAYSVGSPATASILIHDNDSPPPAGSFSNINWSTTSSPPIVLCETTSIVIDNQLYLFGGFTANFRPQKVAYRFDGQTWTRLKDTPVAFTQPGHTLVDGKVWVAGGYIGKDTGGQTFGTSDVRIYDPATDSWSMGPSLPAARATGNMVKVGRKLYFIGGETANRASDSNQMFVYDLDNTSAGWKTGPSMPMARNRAAAVVVDSRIFILGGQNGFDGNLVAHDEIQIFDTAANTWSVGARMLPAVRTHVMNSAQYYKGRIILVTGENAHDKPQNNVWSIDPSTLVTTALNPFPDSRFTTATGIVNGKLYAIGGYRGGIATQGYVGTFV